MGIDLKQKYANVDADRLQLLIDSVRDYAIFMLDPEGRIQTWNVGAEMIKGYKPAEIIGSQITRFYTPEDVAAGRPERLLNRARETGRVEDEGWRVRKDGTRFWADVVITAVRGATGDLVGFIKVTRDLTERRAAEISRLELAHTQEALRLRDEFLSIASHELRTPLGALQLQLDSMRLLGADKLEPRFKTKLERACRNVQRLSDLITTLLDVSRIASGTLTLKVHETDLSHLVAEVVDHLEESAHDARCTVTTQIEPGIVSYLDALRVGQVISNVLANAFKYAAGSAVEVHLRREGDQALVCVHDRGPGLPEGQLERIFERWERLGARGQGGMGLGLYVAREIVIAHGGSIVARNRDGGGATIEARLPIRTSDPIGSTKDAHG